jgi:hypothetical protein
MVVERADIKPVKQAAALFLLKVAGPQTSNLN